MIEFIQRYWLEVFFGCIVSALSLCSPDNLGENPARNRGTAGDEGCRPWP